MSILRNLDDTKAPDDGDTTTMPTPKENDIVGIGGDSTSTSTRAGDETSDVQNGSFFVCFESTEWTCLTPWHYTVASFPSQSNHN